jgi:hypothetical protein
MIPIIVEKVNEYSLICRKNFPFYKKLNSGRDSDSDSEE